VIKVKGQMKMAAYRMDTWLFAGRGGVTDGKALHLFWGHAAGAGVPKKITNLPGSPRHREEFSRWKIGVAAPIHFLPWPSGSGKSALEGWMSDRDEAREFLRARRRFVTLAAREIDCRNENPHGDSAACCSASEMAGAGRKP
jgi:hypothetical protein